MGATKSSDSIRFDQLTAASTESRNNGNNVRQWAPKLHTNVTIPPSQRPLMPPDWPEATPPRVHVSQVAVPKRHTYPTDDLTVTCSG